MYEHLPPEPICLPEGDFPDIRKYLRPMVQELRKRADWSPYLEELIKNTDILFTKLLKDEAPYYLVANLMDQTKFLNEHKEGEGKWEAWSYFIYHQIQERDKREKFYIRIKENIKDWEEQIKLERINTQKVEERLLKKRERINKLEEEIYKMRETIETQNDLSTISTTTDQMENIPMGELLKDSRVVKKNEMKLRERTPQGQIILPIMKKGRSLSHTLNLGLKVGGNRKSLLQLANKEKKREKEILGNRNSMLINHFEHMLYK